MAYYTTSIGQAYGKIVNGRVTVSNAGTATLVMLGEHPMGRSTASSIKIGGVWLSGDTNGSGGALMVGDTDTNAVSGTQSGISIIPGNQAIFLPVDDLAKLYVDSASSGGQLCYAYLQPYDGL